MRWSSPAPALGLAGEPGRGPGGPALGGPAQAAGGGRVRLCGPAQYRRGGARVSPGRAPAHRRRVLLPRAGVTPGPYRGARPRSGRGRRRATARSRSGGRPYHRFPLPRWCRGDAADPSMIRGRASCRPRIAVQEVSDRPRQVSDRGQGVVRLRRGEVRLRRAAFAVRRRRSRPWARGFSAWRCSSNSRADGPVAIPLPVARDHQPGRDIRAASLQGDRVGLLVVVPQQAFVDVGGVELPVLRRIVQPCRQTVALLVLRDVQEALDDGGAVFGQVRLEVVDRLVRGC